MKFKRLRFALSATFGIICLLLIALWVRSYWRWEDAIYQSPTPGNLAVPVTRIGSHKGTLYYWYGTIDNLAENGGEA